MKAVIPVHHARNCPVWAWGIDQAWDDPTKACVCGALALGEGEMLSEKQQRLAEPAAWETDEPLGYALAADSSWDAPPATPSPMRQFPSGATRNTDEGKIDPKGFIHPLVTLSFCNYMQAHRVQADGSVRASDNWTKGIPREAYASSLERHLLDVKLIMAGYASHATTSSLSEALNACMFNVQGLQLEVLLGREPK